MTWRDASGKRTGAQCFECGGEFFISDERMEASPTVVELKSQMYCSEDCANVADAVARLNAPRTPEEKRQRIRDLERMVKNLGDRLKAGK